jgi:hypothetical protein
MRATNKISSSGVIALSSPAWSWFPGPAILLLINLPELPADPEFVTPEDDLIISNRR